MLKITIRLDVKVGKSSRHTRFFFTPVVTASVNFVAMRYVSWASAAKHVPENSQHALRIVH